MVQRFNVVRPKKYKDKNGEEKTAWLSVGQIVKFEDGNSVLEMNDREQTYKIFPVSPKEGQGQTEQKEGDEEKVNVENIPF